MTQPPNVLFTICDDLAWGDLACHGNPHVATPALDALHHESTRLTRYVSGPLCTAARVRLMTGRHDYRTRCIDTYCGRATMDPAEHTLAEVLHAAGYATGLFGKWHLGDTGPSRPHEKGFETALYHTGGGLQQPANLGRRSYFDADLMLNGRLTPTTGYCCDVYTDAALEWLRGRAADGRPWFGYWATNLPHTPLEIGEEWVEPYRDAGLPEPWARIYGMVANIDWNVGRLLAELAALGLADNTIVVFTSDHGPCGSSRANGQLRWNGLLRDGKSTLYEGGIRVPCLVRWPGRCAAGRELDRLANPIDWLPTLAAASGAELPDDRVLDGANLLPLLTGETAPGQWPDRLIGMQWHRGDLPVRGRGAAMVGQQYKWYRRSEELPAELYDITADPAEAYDLAEMLPEIEAELHAAYDAWFDDVSHSRGDTPEANYAPPPIQVGSERENPVGLTWQDMRLLAGVPEGWGFDRPGWWQLHVVQAGWYRLTVDLPRLSSAATLHLAWQDHEEAVPLLPGVETVAPVRTLPAGEQRFEAWVDSDGWRMAVGCVRLLRLP